MPGVAMDEGASTSTGPGAVSTAKTDKKKNTPWIEKYRVNNLPSSKFCLNLTYSFSHNYSKKSLEMKRLSQD